MLRLSILATLAMAVNTVLGEPAEICKPVGPDSMENYIYFNQQDYCDYTGDCKSACVMYVTAYGHGKFTPDIAADLQFGIVNQAVKDGAFKSTNQGKWALGWESGTTALPNHEVAFKEWQTTVSTYEALSDPVIPSAVHFAMTDANGKFYGMTAQYFGN